MTQGSPYVPVPVTVTSLTLGSPWRPGSPHPSRLAAETFQGRGSVTSVDPPASTVIVNVGSPDESNPAFSWVTDADPPVRLPVLTVSPVVSWVGLRKTIWKVLCAVLMTRADEMVARSLRRSSIVEADALGEMVSVVLPLAERVKVPPVAVIASS